MVNLCNNDILADSGSPAQVGNPPPTIEQGKGLRWMEYTHMINELKVIQTNSCMNNETVKEGHKLWEICFVETCFSTKYFRMQELEIKLRREEMHQEYTQANLITNKYQQKELCGGGG